MIGVVYEMYGRCNEVVLRVQDDVRTLVDLHRETTELLYILRSLPSERPPAPDRRLFRRDDRPSPAFGSWSYDVADTTKPPPAGDPEAFAWHPPAGAVPSSGRPARPRSAGRGLKGQSL